MVYVCGPFLEANFTYPESLEATVSSSWGTITADAQVQYQSNVSPSNISVGLHDFSDISTPSAVDLIGGDVNVTEQFSLEFDLTDPSVVHLTGYTDGFVGCSAFYLSGNCTFESQLTLNGPGFQFNGSGTEFDQLSSLQPGVYTLSAVADLQSDVGYAIFGDNEVGADVSLNADFTPVVAEPQWTPVIPAVLVGVCVCVLRKLRPIRSPN
jgi:hypothetical protein